MDGVRVSDRLGEFWRFAVTSLGRLSGEPSKISALDVRAILSSARVPLRRFRIWTPTSAILPSAGVGDT